MLAFPFCSKVCGGLTLWVAKFGKLVPLFKNWVVNTTLHKIIPKLWDPNWNSKPKISKFYLGVVSIRKTVLQGMAIPMLKIRRPNGRLIFNMGIPIPGKDGLYIETGPCQLYGQNISLQTSPDDCYVANVVKHIICKMDHYTWDMRFIHGTIYHMDYQL